jgi:hypothetical protein
MQSPLAYPSKSVVRINWMCQRGTVRWWQRHTDMHILDIILKLLSWMRDWACPRHHQPDPILLDKIFSIFDRFQMMGYLCSSCYTVPHQDQYEGPIPYPGWPPRNKLTYLPTQLITCMDVPGLKFDKFPPCQEIILRMCKPIQCQVWPVQPSKGPDGNKYYTNWTNNLLITCNLTPAYIAISCLPTTTSLNLLNVLVPICLKIQFVQRYKYWQSSVKSIK